MKLFRHNSQHYHQLHRLYNGLEGKVIDQLKSRTILLIYLGILIRRGIQAYVLWGTGGS